MALSVREKRQKKLQTDIAATERRRKLARLLGDDPEDIPPTQEAEEAHTSALEDVAAGVSLTWLHHMFQMDRNTCKMRLAGCPHLRLGPGGGKLYSLLQAAPYLIEPKFDIERTLKNMKRSDLPPNLQPAIWEGKLKRQKWELNAGDLWHTSDVLETFADVFRHMRITMNLWVDKVEQSGLTDNQAEILERLVRDLQHNLHVQLIETPKRRKTRPQSRDLGEIDGVDPV